MGAEGKGGWVYIMADVYRGTMYVGVTACLAERITQHREGRGSDFCAERGDDIHACIEHEKRIKKWRREWKFELIERANPDWEHLYEKLI